MSVCWPVNHEVDLRTRSALCSAVDSGLGQEACSELWRNYAPVGLRIVPDKAPLHGGTVISFLGV